MNDTAAPRRAQLASRVIHAGQSPDPSSGAIMAPIYATSADTRRPKAWAAWKA